MNTNKITMIPIANCNGTRRFIPSDRAEMRIDMKWLESKAACRDGKEWFFGKFPNGCSYSELRKGLADDGQIGWERWICREIGGDSATAGDEGTATAGDRGTATAGDLGTATAGNEGTATAGNEGIIRILEWDEKQGRYRVVTGIIGQDGIQPNVAYVVSDGKLVKKESQA